jgi:tetratricopeptide (TPR) repeat protein
VNALCSYLAMNHWDPHIYHTMQPLICNQIDENEFELMEYMSANLSKVAENYYWLPNCSDIYFEVAIFYHAVKNYEKALYYYQQSQALFEPAFSLLYNAGLCYYHLLRYEEALGSFQKALDLEPYSPDVENWIERIQQYLIKNDVGNMKFSNKSVDFFVASDRE